MKYNAKIICIRCKSICSIVASKRKNKTYSCTVCGNNKTKLYELKDPSIMEAIWQNKSRLDVINKLISTYNYKTYLEIGLGPTRARSFYGVNAEYKESVDPIETDATYFMTSDDFFAKEKSKYDLIFIDGFHEKEQFLRDVSGALSCLNDNGAIVAHDCNPLSDWAQHSPLIAEILTRPWWNGDVWKGWAQLRSTRSDLSMCVVSVDHGCGVIQRGKQSLFENCEYTYQFLALHREQLLNLIDWNQWIKNLEHNA